MNFIKKYWDIISGLITGIVVTAASSFDLYILQVSYSIIILLLVSIGFWRIVKQSIDKNKNNKKERKPTVIDNMVDGQSSVKAVNLATNPTKFSEKLGKTILDILKGGIKLMKKFLEWLDKFKGYILTIALGLLTCIEMCGGYINQLFGGVLEYNGVEILPLVTLILTAIVGCLSNGFTKEQRAKIKALFTKSTTDELVQSEIKKTIKEDTSKLKEYNVILSNQEAELANLQSQLTTAKNTHKARETMFNMMPPIATSEDVRLAANEVSSIEVKIEAKKREIEDTNNSIGILTTKIDALKSQLS